MLTLETPLARTRLAVAGGFATQGFVFISLTTRLPRLAHHWHLGNLALSLLLLLMVLLAGVGSVTAEALARKHASALLLRGGLLAIAVSVPVVLAAGAKPLFVAALAVYGVALGVVDASTNMQAVALEHLYGRPILPSFHGAWTVGGIVGSALTLATGGVPLPWLGLLAVVALVAALARFLPRSAGADDVPSSADVPPDVPWRAIVLVGLALVVFYMIDTGAQTWGPTYLDKVFTTPSALVALATFPYLVASGIARLVGDRLVARRGPVQVLRVGAVVGCASLAVVVFSPTWPLAVLGFTVLGASVAVVAPLSFSAAARIAGGADLDPVARQARVDTVIARFNQFNYVGALLGAVLTGVVGASDLRFGFAVPMVLILALVPLAKHFATPEPAEPTDAAPVTEA